MIILGVDPGTLITGYALLNCRSAVPVIIECEIIRMPGTISIPKRLKLIYDELTKVIKKYKPDEFVIETAFYSKNIQSTLKLGQARGVSLLAAANYNLNITEYSPREIKKSIVGHGNASKEQVKYMIEKILSYKTDSKILDYTDALAIALSHYNKKIILNNAPTFKKWSDFIKNNPTRIKLQ
jgi:crossover junction endodeoxyribonuclease RuvC